MSGRIGQTMQGLVDGQPFALTKVHFLEVFVLLRDAKGKHADVTHSSPFPIAVITNFLRVEIAAHSRFFQRLFHG